jgi:hypothetical protein
MPVILEPGSEEMKLWLDPGKYGWSSELETILKPFGGELDIYPVNKDVGKVGNNSPSFIIPIDSKDNKMNIANFFGNQQKIAKYQQENKSDTAKTPDKEPQKVKLMQDATGDIENTESNAPLPKDPPTSPESNGKSLKRERDDDALDARRSPSLHKAQKLSPSVFPSKPKTSPKKGGKKSHSATSNGSVTKSSPSKAAGSQKITSFFVKKGG